jgi:hypothetical protein
MRRCAAGSKGKGGRRRRGITRPKGRATRASARASPFKSHEIQREARKTGETAPAGTASCFTLARARAEP